MARQPRALESRSANIRPFFGEEAKGRLDIDTSGLPDGMEPCWIRESTHGVYDDDNVQSAMERGYQPVYASELPTYKAHRLPGARGSNIPDDNLIRRGGQVLMARPKEVGQTERDRYNYETQEALRSVARDTTAPKDGKNFRDLEPEISTRVERPRRFSE